mgnify:CR=1 FL=1
MSGLVYLASPYSSPDADVREQRFRTVCKVAAILMRKGIKVFSPIAHTHSIALAGELPTDYAFWREYDEAILEFCSAFYIILMDGWASSEGVRAEAQTAEIMGISIRFVSETGEVLDLAEWGEVLKKGLIRSQ